MKFGGQGCSVARGRACRSELGNGDAAATALSAKEVGEGETEHGRELEDVGVNVMHTQQADEQG